MTESRPRLFLLHGAISRNHTSPKRERGNPSCIRRTSRWRIGLVCLALAGLLWRDAAADDAIEPRPNFIVFLTDDQGWSDLACYGHPIIQSPNLDQFAAEGVRLTQCYSACSVCSPSRSAILTGRTPYRNGVWRWIPAGHQVHLRTSEITISGLLQERGYHTVGVVANMLLFDPAGFSRGFDRWEEVGKTKNREMLLRIAPREWPKRAAQLRSWKFVNDAARKALADLGAASKETA